MSDHWKTLASQFGIPGPADPPAAEKTPPVQDTGTATGRGQASTPEAFTRPRGPDPTIAADSANAAARSAESRAARQRSSMWGDDSETPEAVEKPVPPPRPVVETPRPVVETPRPVVEAPRPVAETSRPSDPLEAIANVQREPIVPGFNAPEGYPPEPPKAPVKRSAWDALIGTLGIKTSSETASPIRQPAPSREPSPNLRPAAPPERVSDRAAAEADSNAPAGRRDSTGRPGRDEPRRPPAFRSEPSVAESEPVGFGAGLIDDSPSAGSPSFPEETANGADGDRPRGRGRRGGARRRGRGQGDREAGEVADSDIGWDAGAAPGEAEPRGVEPRGVEPRADRPSRERPIRETFDSDAPAPRGVRDSGDLPEGAATGTDDAFGAPRRSRRRGQRQMMTADGLDLAPAAGERQRESVAPARDDDFARERPRRREESAGRERPPRPEVTRSEGSRPAAGRPDRDRPRPSESVARPADRRPPRSLPGDDDLFGPDEDLDAGFGAGLVAEPKPEGAAEDEPRRPRRRRGRRGRGGAAREDRPVSEGASEIDDSVDDSIDASLEVAPFDDDLEDDDEADRIRRRSRGGRNRGGRREPVAAVADGDSTVVDPPHRGETSRTEPVGDPKARMAPTWLETVSILVDSNIQRRSSGGGGGGGGQHRGGGRGGRR